MNYQRAFTFIFDDEKWLTKCLLGLAILIVPILNFAWVGYILHLINNPDTLPEWDHLDELWIRGLKYILGAWIYALPIVFLLGFPALFSLIPILASSNGTQDGAVIWWVLLGIFTITSLCLVSVYGLFLSFFIPAIRINYAKEDKFSALFACKKFYAIIREQFSTYATVWIIGFAVSLVASIAASFVSMFVGWVPFIGGLVSFVLSLFAGQYSQLVSFHLYGQLAQK